MQLAARVLRTIRAHRMLPRGGRVLVALSGGPDSVALLDILQVLERRGELRVAGVAHFNHQLRAAEADADEQFCRDLAARLALPIEVGRGDVAGDAARSGRSLEDTARALRYAFLHDAADRLGADVIAVGHSRDDQAETFLLRLLRGAGPRGLAGIRPRAGRVVRPLLEIGREDLRRHAGERGLSFRDDATNRDVRIPRNRVRHELMPCLLRVSPAIVRILAREADVAREDEAYLSSAAIDSAAAVVLEGEVGIELDAAALGALPPALGARVARHALARVTNGRFVSSQHLEALLGLATGRDGASAALPGTVAVRRGGRIVLGLPPAVPPFSRLGGMPLPVPGEVVWAGWALEAGRTDAADQLSPPRGRGDAALVAAGPLREPLAVRARRRGDRFQPLGMGGRGRKLQDFLVDRKVPRHERDALPLVVDRDDRIVWVVGHGVAEDFRVTEPSQGVILLTARRLGGVG